MCFNDVVEEFLGKLFEGSFKFDGENFFIFVENCNVYFCVVWSFVFGNGLKIKFF